MDDRCTILKWPVPLTTPSGLMYTPYLILQTPRVVQSHGAQPPSCVQTIPVINYAFMWFYLVITLWISRIFQNYEELRKNPTKTDFYRIYPIFLKKPAICRNPVVSHKEINRKNLIENQFSMRFYQFLKHLFGEIP